MALTRTKVLAKLKSTHIPADLCWGKPREFVQKLTEILTAELSVSPNHDFVIIGHTNPSEDDKEKLWVRTDRSNRFLGFFMFQDGAWSRIHNYRADEVIWMVGDSTDIPPGFALIDDNTGDLTTNLRNAIVGKYILAPGATVSNPVYSYFAVRWVGF